MADSKHTPLVCFRRRLLPAIIACSLALAAAGAWAGAARADGDPASDVLATQPLFLPADARIPAPRLVQLRELVAAASQAGFQIHVALIASASDLGSITELWRQPALYAKFLGEELSLTYRGLLLVVMPDGFGVYDRGGSVTRYLSALDGIAIHPSGEALASTALDAIRQLAASTGHPLGVPRVGATSMAGSGSGSDPTAWAVFAAGLVLAAIAWTASLRARPLRLGRTRAPAA